MAMGSIQNLNRFLQMRAISEGLKRPEGEAKHSAASRNEFKKKGSSYFTPLHRENCICKMGLVKQIVRLRIVCSGGLWY